MWGSSKELGWKRNKDIFVRPLGSLQCFLGVIIPLVDKPI